MEPTHDTFSYMIAGYAIAFLVMGLYIFSMYLRHRSLSQDLETLEIISNESKPNRGKASKPRVKRV